jgi:hypothetical protein
MLVGPFGALSFGERERAEARSSFTIALRF